MAILALNFDFKWSFRVNHFPKTLLSITLLISTPTDNFFSFLSRLKIYVVPFSINISFSVQFVSQTWPFHDLFTNFFSFKGDLVGLYIFFHNEYVFLKSYIDTFLKKIRSGIIRVLNFCQMFLRISHKGMVTKK